MGFTNVFIGLRNELFLQEGLDDPNQLEFARQISIYAKSNFRPAGSMHEAIAAPDCPSGQISGAAAAAQLLNLTGPLAVLWSALKFMEQQGRHGYARYTVSLDGGPILTAEGVTIETAPISQFEGVEIDTIVFQVRWTWSPRLPIGTYSARDHQYC